MSRPLLFFVWFTGICVGCSLGLAVRQPCDCDGRVKFALDIADVALGTAATHDGVTKVALARCRDKWPLPPMVP